jgi:hypothetical protein
MTTYTPASLEILEDYELRGVILTLQRTLDDLTISEAKSSAIHNYHFTSNEVLKLGADKYMGSAVIISIFDLKGKPLITPTTISDGFSNNTINCLLDDLQRTFNHKIEFTPTVKRLK